MMEVLKDALPKAILQQNTYIAIQSRNLLRSSSTHMERMFKILNYTQEGKPNSIKRLADAMVFTIGEGLIDNNDESLVINAIHYIEEQDWATAATPRGEFDLRFFNPDGNLPSKFFNRQVVKMEVHTDDGKVSHVNATVRAVHFHQAKAGATVKYDIGLWYDRGNTEHRIYNVVESLLSSL